MGGWGVGFGVNLIRFKRAIPGTRRDIQFLDFTPTSHTWDLSLLLGQPPSVLNVGRPIPRRENTSGLWSTCGHSVEALRLF